MLAPEREDNVATGINVSYISIILFIHGVAQQKFKKLNKAK